MTPDSTRLEDARALVGVLHLLSPSLRHIPPGMRNELARLAARWLDAGYAPADVHTHVLRCLPGAGTPVHRPGGLVRYLLRDVPPRDPMPETESAPESAPASVSAPVGQRLSARLEGARECAGDGHTQPMLFRGEEGQTLCGECRRNQLLPALAG
ncbi:hypothetical protein [Streptomyces sp. NPDC093089]|uniref:hypothetical protein n=1 Tax=Streptomyces sp. NPDC093089 TaxID=3366024 RepID=UPI0038203EF3